MDHDRVSDLLTDGCTSFSVPGAQVGLVRGDDRLVVCAGTRDLDVRAPVDPETSFHAGSLAKSLTALVVVEAARRGEVDLDRLCDQQAPGLRDDTPRELMAQTTGRPNVLPELEEGTETFVRGVGGDAFVRAGDPPGGMTIAIDGDVLYVGPFACARTT